MGEPDPAGDLVVRIARGPVASPAGARSRGRSDKRAAIVEAATALFLRHGYTDTVTEDIAAAAGVSKQTVYNHFGDKQRLFTEIIIGVSATAERFVAEIDAACETVLTADDVEPTLIALGHRQLVAATSPQVVALRRLVIGEATRFPELAAAYYERAPGRVLSATAGLLGHLSERGLLVALDATEAARHFAFLVLGYPLDHGMFHRDGTPPSDTEIRRRTAAAVRVFLAAYRP